MHIKEQRLEFIDAEQVFSFSEEFKNGLHFVANVYCENAKFLDYQKDLLQEFIAEYIDILKIDIYDLDEIKSSFEIALQNLNTRLKLFADKVHDVEYFALKWYVQIIADNTLISSMIWNSTLMIFRNNRVFYSLHNSLDNKSKIDLFSDFVEGDLEIGDQIIYTWTKISDVLDDNDLTELEDILDTETSIVAFLEEILSARMDIHTVSFINHYTVKYMSLGIKNKKAGAYSNSSRNNKRAWKIKRELLANKYYLTIVILWVVILFLLYHVLSQVLTKTNTDVFVTSSWVEVDVTIEDIKKDIYLFQSLDPTSDEKWVKYHEIMQELDMLESKWRRLEDVAQLRTILQSDYHKWFNIIYINAMTQFDDAASNINSQILSFNNVEKDKLWQLMSLEWWRNLYIAGSNWVIIGAINDNMRWTLMEYSTEEFINGCSTNLLRDGLYCYSKDGNIFSVTKSGVEPVTTDDPGGFPSEVADVKVYGKSNMYIFQSKLDALGKNVLLTRYRNVIGSQSQFQWGSNYKVNLDSGENFSGFTAFNIDSTFLAWSDGKLYQFWREEASAALLEAREVPLLWWDKLSSAYSNDVKILASLNSKYVYIFDKTNQSFTVYESRPIKTNDNFTADYSLYYLFRFTFDLDANKVVDVVIPEETGNRPELYLLTTNGINKVSLYDFIDSIKENNALKTVAN